MFDQGTEILQSALRSSYLDAMLENIENVIDNDVQVEDGVPDAATVKKLQELYQQMDVADADAETLRQL
ncbi:MAG: class I SAM-dependent methyltransferase, partial [Limosilactobacillus sp.]